VRSDQIITLTVFYSRQVYPERLLAGSFLCLSDEQLRFACPYHCPAVQKAGGKRELFKKWIKQHLRI